VSVPTLSVNELSIALRGAWSAATSADPEGWASTNPSWGQCAVSALIVQDFFGGQILRTVVGDVSHYWNLLPSGEEVDLTREQFGRTITTDDALSRPRDYLLSFEDTRRRYALLRRRVNEWMPSPALA
jgi:hypothetical protein